MTREKIVKKYSSYQDYLNSSEWAILSRIAREQAEHRCRICNNSERLHVHHREYPKQYGTEPLSSLVVLCADCHSAYHDKNRLPACEQERGNVKPTHIKQLKKMNDDAKAKKYIEFLEAVAEKSIVARAMLDSSPISIENDELSIVFYSSVVMNKLNEDFYRVPLKESARVIFGDSVKILFKAPWEK